MPDWLHRRQLSNRAVLVADCARFGVASLFLETLRPWSSEQVVSGDEQIRQRTGDEQPLGILRDATVAHLGKAKHALDDPIECSTRARTLDATE